MDPSATLLSSSASVLLVDDQPIVGEMVARALANESDIELHLCYDGREAVSVARELKPTVILQDLVMPGVEGLDVVRSYRADPATAHIPVIVLSSREQPIIKSAAFVAGASDYLVKLPDAIELIARIRYHSNSYIAALQRNEALDFLSHDMRSPLASILALIETHRGKPEPQQALLERIASHASTALALADGFAHLARAQSEWLHVEEFDLGDLVEVAADQLWEKAQARHSRISVNIPAQAHPFVGDRLMLTRAVSNLIDNALKYGPAGSEVRCTLAGSEGTWSISVEDEGPGIPESAHEKALQRFGRLPSHVASNVDGYGLGLAFVNVAAMKHHGSVAMRRADTGFAVTLLLPRTAAA
ncbi:hybrid sensor histidine kinase/response regulator [Paraburkholderia megapolitana]|uniref:histidine kinase n=1 Tax=Paraburkholderia megapolitana TaxID=420953 RepID=A0A1I3GJR1_9BURK|nr:hybrid sensor histidine kinase/response regulator [Paraburkholderia megapolitana]QDQ82933.1 response regulator [Paraburkholderia megapolitana]SFI23709.1 response regulator receiver sensor signal transduction histidine kinase [Paraburkholderia megapolitana]